MKRWEIINYLIKLNNFNNYLEIGYGNGDNFSKIEIKNKIGVDPNSDCDFKMTSDDFFVSNNKTFDIIFIDGLHIYEQVKKDFFNSLKFLNKNGIIVLHDCNPTTFEMQRVDTLVHGEWTGDVWKLIVELKSSYSNLYVSVINTDYGCGIVKIGNQKLIDVDKNLDYNLFSLDRKKLLNLIDKENFISHVENMYNTSRD